MQPSNGRNQPGQQAPNQTPHFRLHCAPGSYAEKELVSVASRLEQAHAAMGALLGTTGAGPIEVYLAEILDDPQRPGTPLPGGGYALVRRRQIYEVYRADAPGFSLERSLLLVLLADAVGEVRQWPPMLAYGLLNHVSQQLGAFPPEEQTLPALAAAQDQLPPAVTLLTDPAPARGGTAYLAAGNVVGFLLRTYGPECFRDFLRRLGSGAPEAAARAAFGKDADQIDKSWRKSLLEGFEGPGGGGTIQFTRAVLRFARPYRVKVAEVLFLIILSVAFTIALARVQGLIFDRAILTGDLRTLGIIMGILAVAFVLILLASLRETYLLSWITESIMRSMRLRIFTHLQFMHPGFFQKYPTGDIMSRMTSDLSFVELALGHGLTQGIHLVLLAILAFVTIFTQDWRLALLALIGMPFTVLANRWIGPAAERASIERGEEQGRSSTTLQENLGAQAVVKAFGLQDRMIGNFTENLNSLFRAATRVGFLSGLIGVTGSAVTSAINLAVLGVGAYLVIGGNLTVGTLIAFLSLLGQIIGPIQSISGVVGILQQASGSLSRIEELLQAEPAIKDAPNARAIGPVRDAIRFHDVTFSYTGDRPQLRGVTLTIPAGSTVALVGPSGCGKSTVLNQILRFYEPQQGRVTFDGVDVKEVALESLRAQIGMVFQESILFNISIRENIRLGNQTASDAEVEAAAKAAEIHDIIIGMPEGYDTLVGERGGRLSGGQRQRVAIARAIIRNPSVLLLDEATSALDPRTEAAINDTLDRLARGRTTISVTHRLASIVNYSHILVFDKGELVEQGTHDELVARGGLYANLWQEQGGFEIKAGVQRVGVEVDRLAAVPLFTHLDRELLVALAGRLNVERFPAGEAIVRQGDFGDKLFMIYRGQVEVLLDDPSGRTRPLATLRDGDHFGELALLYDVPRTATVRAKTPVQMYSLDKEDFNLLLGSVPHLRDRLDRTVAERAQAAMGR